MATPDSEYFYELPSLTSNFVAELGTGQELALLLLEHVPSGGGVVFPVQYIHKELIYRTPGQKDAVALGTARLTYDREFRNVRILFSRPHKTATLRGLTLEGQVKVRTGRGLTIRSSRTCFATPTTWQVKLAMLSAPLRRSA